uniref:Uncharacterized protein n=1 Tax=Panagrolaimus superbus TaxID=310955 RepID=A0A914YPT3_9BILA
MGDMYEPLGPVPAGDLPPPPPPPPAAAANLDPLSHAPPQTKFENALGNANTSKTDLRSAPSAPVSKKGNSKDNKGSSKNNNKKNKSKQNSLKTEENVQDDDEEDEEQDGAERIKKWDLENVQIFQ